MYTFLTRNGQTVAFGLGLAVTIIMLAIIFSGVNDFESIPETDALRYDTTIFNFGMYAALLLGVIGALAAIGFGIYQFATDPKGALKGMLGLAAVIVLLLVLYATADPDTSMLAAQAKDGFFVTEGQSKFITGAIATSLIMAGGAILALAISEVLSFFR